MVAVGGIMQAGAHARPARPCGLVPHGSPSRAHWAGNAALQSPAGPAAGLQGRRASARRRVAVAAEPKGSAGEELLDFMMAGRKLRRWYGEEGLVLPKDGGGPQGGGEEEGDDEPDMERDTILVLDADSPTGEQVVLQLILARQKIKALVKDAAAASAGFGPYITAVQGGSGDAAALRGALRGVRAVVSCGRLGVLLPAARAAGVQHLVLLSSAGAPRRGLALFGGGEAAALGDPEREQQVLRSGIPATVVQVGAILDEPGTGAIAVSTGGAPAGEICREDAASVLARAATAEPPAGGALVVQVQNSSGSGALDEWEAALDALLERQVA